MPNIDLSILNQRQTPAFYASSLATRPAFGFAGRIFIDTDSPSTGLYRDTGAAWVQIADPGAGTTGTLQQVTTNGKTTNQGITITAGGLTLGTNTGDNQTLLNLPANTSLLYREGAGSLYGFNIGAGDNSLFLNNIEGGYYQTLYFGDGINTNIFGISASDDAGVTYNSVFVVNQNKLVGINTNTPTATFDVHGDVSVIQQLNQTTATNNTLLAFQNSNAGLWRIGNFYNAGANDFGVFDVIGAIQPITVKKTTGQVLIGTSTVGSGKLVVASSTGDNGVQIVGATAPSLRIDNSESGPTKRVGLGISTATNNFIQGSADRDFCIFNGSTTASPMLFGIYDAAAVNVQEAARISASRNFLIGTTTDNGQRFQVNGSSYFTGTIGVGITPSAWAFSGLSAIQIKNASFFGFSNSAYMSANEFVNSAGDSIYIASSSATRYAQNLGTHIWYNAASGTAGNTISFTEIMRTSASANLLIGTTTDGGQKLQVNGTSAFSDTVNITTSSTVISVDRTGAGTALIELKTNNTIRGYLGCDVSTPFIFFNQSAVARMSIKTNTVNIQNIPTSAAGLVSGDIYSNLGVLTIVP